MLYYPLTYDRGSLLESNEKIIELRHLVDTIAGERVLFPGFGVPLDVLYTTNIPAILSERIRLTASQAVGGGVQTEIIDYANGELKLKIILATGQEAIATYATS